MEKFNPIVPRGNGKSLMALKEAKLTAVLLDGEILWKNMYNTPRGEYILTAVHKDGKFYIWKRRNGITVEIVDLSQKLQALK